MTSIGLFVVIGGAALIYAGINNKSIWSDLIAPALGAK